MSFYCSLEQVEKAWKHKETTAMYFYVMSQSSHCKNTPSIEFLIQCNHFNLSETKQKIRNKTGLFFSSSLVSVLVADTILMEKAEDFYYTFMRIYSLNY